ncbi:neural-cadherin-like [Anopheles arabiensis]|uniref:neural-cadherin-like n=1 Tax=Anopheles arabiensis TaxID=7173 RepID=UPI001AADB8AD|nr:neural-cadherin-like [Anopheles arabiensis]
MTAVDMKTLKIPIGPLPELVQHKAPPVRPDIAVVSDQVVGKVDVFLDDRKRRVDIDSASGPFDDLRNYAYEGCASTSGSLNPLQSGPRFDKLFNIYEPSKLQIKDEDVS